MSPHPRLRKATCRCGQLTAECAGEPLRISVCHCLACQRRTGSAFGVQARWPEEHVQLVGLWNAWERVADSGRRETYRFCPTCGAVVAYTNEGAPGQIAVPVGAFADTAFPTPEFTFYERRQHAWVTIVGDDIQRSR